MIFNYYFDKWTTKMTDFNNAMYVDRLLNMFEILISINSL